MSTVQDWLKGYKTYIILIAYAALVLITGKVPEGTEDAVAGFNMEAIEKSLLAAAFGTGKAAWNRYTESH